MIEKCECVKGTACCEREGCGDQVAQGARFLWVEEAGAEDGDLEHRLCQECVAGK
jgi:hypothetical protein